MDKLCSAVRPGYPVMNNKVLFFFSISGSMKWNLTWTFFLFIFLIGHRWASESKERERGGYSTEVGAILEVRRKFHLNHYINVESFYNYFKGQQSHKVWVLQCNMWPHTWSYLFRSTCLVTQMFQIVSIFLKWGHIIQIFPSFRKVTMDTRPLLNCPACGIFCHQWVTL